MIEVMREATRHQASRPFRQQLGAAFLTNPAKACGFAAQSLAPGAPANMR